MNLSMNSADILIKINELFKEKTFESFEDFRAKLDGQELDQVITEREDVFHSYETLFALNRVNRPMPASKESKKTRTENCLFDDLEKVAKPIIEFKDWEVYSASNPFAFNTGDHEVIFTKEHVEFIEDIQIKHIEGILRAIGSRTRFILDHQNVDQVSCGINFGTDAMKHSAGASQPHLHAQIGAIYKGDLLPDVDNMFKVVNTITNSELEFVNLYLDEIRSRFLLVNESSKFAVFCPFAPRFKDELHIISKDILKLSDLEDELIADELSTQIYNALMAYNKIGIESFNVEFLQNNNIENYKSFSLIKISPRESEIAYSEISGRYVVDRFPEKTAEMLREFFII